MRRLAHVAEGWSPWSPTSVRTWSVLMIVGHAACAVAWWGASRRASVDEQLAWTNLAIIGAAVVAYGDVTWLWRARKDIRSVRVDLLAAVTGGIVQQTPDHQVLAVAGLVRFHRPGCGLATAEMSAMESDAAVAAGHERCGICRP